MNAKLSGLGAEPKKLVALGGLLVVAGYFYFSNRTSGPSGGPGPAAVAPASQEEPVPLKRVTARPGRSRGLLRGNSRATAEFRPSLKASKELAIDPSSIDPTLRLDLLEKVQNVTVGDVTRSLFETLSSPPVAADAIPEPKKIEVAFQYYGPPPPPKEVAKVEPPPPPIPLKFYGFISPAKTGVKRAFFLDGDDIIVATEGQLVKNRYKVVRIGINSADVEDTQFKNHKQTLALVEEQPS